MDRVLNGGDLSRPTVWIVDDSPLEAELAARALVSRFDVSVFREGHSALERIADRGPPDTLVLDWLLPDISGVDVCRFLRANPATSAIPVLVLSVRSATADVLEGLTAGADDYLSKPFDPAELAARVTVLVRARRSLQRAERAERALRILLENLPDLVVALDADGRVAFANAEAARRLGETRETLLGRELGRLLPGLDVERAAEEGGHADYALGDRVYAPFARRLTQSDHAAVALVLRDVTADRLAAHQARLADQRKDEFLAMLGHELRNPLSAISSALTIMETHGADPETARRTREILARQTAHMTRMIDDLLDVSRITRGKIQLRREPVDLGAAASRAVETIRATLRARGHHLTLTTSPEPLVIDGDPTRIEQVLVNLLQNAAKYTPPGGHIALTVARDGDDGVVRVRDDGVGIPAAALPHIFDLFTQVDNSLDRAQGGLGIGLTLVRSIVALHGGRVSARSEGAGRGSEFEVRVPLSGRPAPADAPSASRLDAAPLGGAMRVLVVDDNEDLGDMTAMALDVEGYDVSVARDGLSALDEAARTRPDVVLLDLGLPGIDGFEVARRIRADPARVGTLLVAISGYGQESDRKRSREAGFDRHFVKPVDFDALCAMLAQHRAGRSLNR